MLGVRWAGQDRTQDIDFARAGKAISLVLPSNVEVHTDEAISSLNMGFLPVSGLDGKTGGAYLWDHRREPLDEALADLLSRGKGWTSRFKQGVQALNKAYPELAPGKMLLSATSG